MEDVDLVLKVAGVLVFPWGFSLGLALSGGLLVRPGRGRRAGLAVASLLVLASLVALVAGSSAWSRAHGVLSGDGAWYEVVGLLLLVVDCATVLVLVVHWATGKRRVSAHGAGPDHSDEMETAEGV